MKKNHFKMLFGFIVMALFMLSCENNLEIMLPPGPQGEKGDKGDPGKSAFELWKELYGKDESTTLEEFFESLRGPQGFTPVADEATGNWFINGENTGKPWRGVDGTTPTVAIGPGPGYFWIINGETTNVSAKGQDGEDGEDGFTPYIGENGNWFINGVDQNKPSVIIPTIGPGPNFNWFINGDDTGYPSRGADGAPGKTAYELWVSHLGEDCDGTITLNDNNNTPWPCERTSWEDFLEWLQGGNVSVLHQYWITLPGNEGKTIEQFIGELFDCHCDGITVSVLYTDECVELNPDGTLKGTYNAQLRVGGTGGTQVQVTGNGVDLSGSIADDTTPLLFTIPRGDESIRLTIACTQSGNTVTKHADIPALKYVKPAATPTVTRVSGQQKDEVTIEFTTAPVELSVDGTVIYDADGIAEGSGWAVSNEGKTFTRTYDRMATEQKPTVEAKGDNGACSTIEEAFTIPQLTPVEVEGLTLSIADNCTLSLTLNGTEGMTVRAMDASNHDNFVTLTESPAGTYTTSEIPRTYNAYTLLVRAEIDGRGTVEKTIEVEGTYLTPVADPLTISQLSGVVSNTSIALEPRRLTNNTSAPLTVTVTRGDNNANDAERHPESPEFPLTRIIPANGFVDVDFYRDYTETFAHGQYVLTFTSETECGLEKKYTLIITNLQNYRYAFTIPEGWGDGSGDPNDLITFEVSVFDAIPDSYVEFQLFTGTVYAGASRLQLDENGSRTWNVTMTRSQLQEALDNVQGFFLFFSDSGYINKYNIGADKEEIIFAFE